MTAIYYYKGDIIDYTPAANMEAGDIAFVGTLAGVASHPITANTLGALGVTGAYKVAKASATTFALGAKVYYSTSTKLATASTSDKLLGIAIAAGVSGEEEVLVKINA